MPSLSRCICCGRDLDSRLQFSRNSLVCTLCAGMSANEAAITTRATIERERALNETSATGRATLRRQKYLEAYALQGGKKCSSCHSVKQLDAFGVCNPRPDGLQSNCKACNKLEVELRKQAGGAVLWHTVRDSLRAKAAAESGQAK